MKSYSALKRADCAVKLYAETAVYVSEAFVVVPGNAEVNYAFGFDHSVQHRVFDIFGFGVKDRLKRGQHFARRLMKQFFSRIFFNDILHQGLQIFFGLHC